MKIELFAGNGSKKGNLDLPEAMFNAKVNRDLMHRAVVLRQANARTPIAHTLTRAEVAMTTKKAFKQKGTGRARRGALSSGLLRGGGVIHGPRNTRNFSVSMPKKERRLALFSSLTIKATANEIFALEGFNENEPKTKKFVTLLSQLPTAKKYLFVLAERNPILEKSIANVPNVEAILASYINVYDVLKAEKICFLQESIPVLEKTFLSKKK